MNNHELLRERVRECRHKETLRIAAQEVKAQAERKYHSAAENVDHANKCLANAIWSKCEGKSMLFEGKVYSAIKNQLGNVILEIDKFDGEVL